MFRPDTGFCGYRSFAHPPYDRCVFLRFFPLFVCFVPKAVNLWQYKLLLLMVIPGNNTDTEQISDNIDRGLF